MACFFLSTGALYGHGEATEELIEHFDDHLEDFTKEVDVMAGQIDAIVAGYNKSEPVETAQEKLIELWEEAEIHQVLEVKAVLFYPPVTQGIFSLKRATESSAEAAAVVSAGDSAKAALWQGLGAIRMLATLEVHEGHKGHDLQREAGQSGTDTQDAPPAADQAANRIELTGDDSMQYNKNHFIVHSGKPVTLQFEHTGQLPKEAMGHNVVVLQPGTPIEPFGQAAAKAKNNDYIPTGPAEMKSVVAYTSMLGGGEKETITFTLQTPGKYPFICSFPGHVILMQGTIEAL